LGLLLLLAARLQHPDAPLGPAPPAATAEGQPPFEQAASLADMADADARMLQQELCDAFAADVLPYPCLAQGAAASAGSDASDGSMLATCSRFERLLKQLALE
jgi:hypothetical protein